MENNFILEYLTESTNISFLYEPSAYYDKLCDMFKNAKKKIVISCLYIGTLPLEQEFVNNIIHAKRNTPDLIIDILLDKQRSCRKENTGKCILDLVQPLLKENNVSLRLFHSPLLDSVLNSLLRPPFSEVLGTLHMKIYVADNTTVITGANCSTPYFTKRMDRYMVVEDELFSDVMYTVVSALGSMAYKADENLNFVWDSDVINPLDDWLLFKKQIYVRLLNTIKLCNDTLQPILYNKIYDKSRFKYNKINKINRIKIRKRQPYNSKNSASSPTSTLMDASPTSTPLMAKNGCDGDELNNGSGKEESQSNDTPTLLLINTNTKLKELYNKTNIIKINKINKIKYANSFASLALPGNSYNTPSTTASVFSGGMIGSETPTSQANSEVSPNIKNYWVVKKTLSGEYNVMLTRKLMNNRLNRRNESEVVVDDEYANKYWDSYSPWLSKTYKSDRRRGIYSRFIVGRQQRRKFNMLKRNWQREGGKKEKHTMGNYKENILNMIKLKKVTNNNEYCIICNNYNNNNISIKDIDYEDYKPYNIKRMYPPIEGYTRFMIFFQMGFSLPAFRQDEVLCKDLMLKYRKSGHSIVLVTSYLNFTEEYSNLSNYLFKCNTCNDQGRYYMVTSAPLSNDFYNCTDYKRAIPMLYCYFQDKLLHRMAGPVPNRSTGSTSRSVGSGASPGSSVVALGTPRSAASTATSCSAENSLSKLDHTLLGASKMNGSAPASIDKDGVRSTSASVNGSCSSSASNVDENEQLEVPEDETTEKNEEISCYYEYYRSGYTFHNKGIFIFNGNIPGDCKKMGFNEFKKKINGPCAVLIGSSNLSRRSHNKDFEMNILVETNSINVLDCLKFELYLLFKNADAVTKNAVKERLSLFHRVMAFIFRQYF